MSTKHTPGPWIAESALTGGQIPVGPHPLHRVAVVNGRAGEQEANAALIAAAPDLLEALRALVESDGLAFYHDDDIEGTVRVCVHCHEFSQTPAEIDHDASCIVGKARAAIAKAEGRS